LRQLRNELDPSLYNGATFLGLQKTVIKSHGNADEKAFLQALIVAREQVIQNVPVRIQKMLSTVDFQ
jgi:glycerol-3-phosphate acyltransferase PlsX